MQPDYADLEFGQHLHYQTVGPPSTPAFVGLRSTLPNLAAPRAVTVPAGSTSSVVSIVAFTVTENATGCLMATYNGSSQSVPITLLASVSEKSLQLSCDSSRLAGGDSTACTVRLAQGAPTGGSTVTLAADNRRVRIRTGLLLKQEACQPNSWSIAGSRIRTRRPPSKLRSQTRPERRASY